MIIDPGQDAQRGIEDVLARYRLKPIAVLLTHGHIDHVWSVAPVCGARGVPAYIHPGDRDLLSDPGKGLSANVGQQLFGGMTFTEPDDVLELADGAAVSLAGLTFTVTHAPGHTEGSVTFATGTASAASAGAGTGTETGDRSGEGTLFSGDLLFAGSIGRTDLPGGDYPTILDSLARVCLALPDETQVLPGHGPQTTIGAERASNPFLAAQPGSPAGPASGRGLPGRPGL